MSDLDFFALFSIEETDCEPVNKTRNVSRKKCETFENWQNLPNELKQIVISNLNFKGRLNLSLCSKSMCENVKNSKIILRGLKIVEETGWICSVYSSNEEQVKFVTVEVEFDCKRDNRFDLKFVNDEKEGCTLVSKYGNNFKKKRSFRTTNDYVTEAKNFAIDCMEKCDFNLRELTVEMKTCSFQSNSIKSLDNLKYLRLSAADEEWLLWWMNKAGNSKINSLQLLSPELSSKFIDNISLQLNSCDNFYFWACPLFTDQQFLKLTAKSMNFNVGASLSDEAINYFITRWVDGKIRKDFVKLNVWIKRSYEKNLILNNLNGKLWNEEFIENSRGFTWDFEHVVGRGECYQMENKLWQGISATLMLSDDGIVFMVTGTIHNGWNCYYVPA